MNLQQSLIMTGLIEVALGKTRLFKDIEKELHAGGPGSGRHKGFDEPILPAKKLWKPPLRTVEREEQLERTREAYRQNQGAIKKKGLSRRGKPILSAKALRSQKNMVVADKGTQDKAEELERLVAKRIGGTQSDNNKAFDVTHFDSKGQHHGIEVKAVLLQKDEEKLTMNKEARLRKIKWGQDNNAKIHTVAVDLRGKTPVVYHREGVGSYYLKNMNKVDGGLSGLHKLFA